jgi:serine/threonine protein kinase/tetratricopeptide (TPR) repeat protein
MDAGDTVAERFDLEFLAGSGGMGAVWRARDRVGGGAVAVKLMREQDADVAARFAREAEVLADLRHPGIVRYVAHGKSGGELWLAMEWLEGESLAERLRRQGMTLEESLTFARRTAEALAAAHRRGVVHRDLKPSNLFLVEGSVDRVKLLDFGIARLRENRRQLTITGSMLGTPGYMAPEQARGEPDVDARADVFAFGCVLFKCITGRAAFSGDDGLAVLLRVVLEDAPRLSEVRDDVPGALDELVARVLSKEPAGRPADGAALVAELEALGALSGRRATRASTSPPALTTTERRVMCLLVARVGRPAAAAPSANPSLEAPTEITAAPEPPPDSSVAPLEPASPTLMLGSVEGTIQLHTGSGTFDEIVPVLADWTERERALRAVAERYGGKLHWLADGSLLVTVDSAGAATDQASRAAHCTLEMRPLLPAVPMALVAGRAVISRRLPMGEVIDRAVGMLSPNGGEVVRLDEVVAGLLDARFDVGGDQTGLLLRGKRDVAEARRTLLGRPSPCVGREREIASLEAIYDECVAEGAARAVVVTAAAGVGKSRLRYELMARLSRRSQPGRQLAEGEARTPMVWFSRGDPMSAGSPFGMVVRAVQRAAGLLDGEPLLVRQQKLRARVARHVPPADRARVTEFLGELCGVRFEDTQSVQLRAARGDAMLMGDQMRRAWEDWLAAECAAQPVLLVLEDLQWGDLPTVKLVDSALRNLADRPWMVLALGRAEVHDLFPRLWAGRAVTQLHLGDLTKRGCEKLVREMLGADVDSDVVARLVDRAAGNAFYLEELIRAVVEGRGDSLPETVIAMVQARLETLAPDGRRLLRAASVFGQIFWPGGVAALIGGEERTGGIGEWLAELVDREVVARRGEGRFPGQDEHIFRHALLREAAYAMLTDGDRALGHRLAGEWLELAGETDAVVLAEHFERGGEPGRAIVWFRRAAEQALEGNDFAAARERAERGVASGAEGEVLGVLRLLQAEAHGWRGENAEAERHAVWAMSALSKGTATWYAASGQAALASGRLGNPERLATVARELTALYVADETESTQAGKPRELRGPEVVAAAHTAGQLLYAGRAERAERLLERLDDYERRAARTTEVDPSVRAWVHSTRATQALFDGDPGAYLLHRRGSAEAFEQAGDLRNACIQRVSVGYAYLELGAHREAEQALRDALSAGERMGLSHACALARHNLGLALALQGRLEEARTLESEAAAAFEAQGNRRLEGGARIYLAMILTMLGDLETADQEARLAVVVVSAPSPPGRAQALATLAQVKLARASIAEALDAAREAMELLESLGGLDEGESLVRLMYAEALAAAGDHARAREAIAAARHRLLERAAKISDPGWRRSFLERVPENARTMSLATAWCG